MAERTVKIIIVGNFGVGKSSLFLRLFEDTFHDKPPVTTSDACRTKSIVLGGRATKISMWDTVGQERLTSSPPNYYRDAEGIILVYDITDAKSFEKLETWLNQVNTYGGENAIKILVGNKTDDQERRVVTPQQGQEFAGFHQMQFFEISVKDNDNVEEAYNGLLGQIEEEILDREAMNQPRDNNIRVNNNGNTEFDCWEWFKNLFKSS